MLVSSNNFKLLRKKGEGSFCVVFKLKASLGMGIQVAPEISVTQHTSGKYILDLIKQTLNGVGSEVKLKEKSSNVYVYRVTNLDQLMNVAIPFLQKYMVVSARRREFELVTNVCNMISNKEHLTIAGMTKIINVVFDTPLKKTNRQLSKSELLYVLGDQVKVAELIESRRQKKNSKQNK